ncbi:hypothetical protein, partial [Xanthomonas hortorum]
SRDGGRARTNRDGRSAWLRAVNAARMSDVVRPDHALNPINVAAIVDITSLVDKGEFVERRGVSRPQPP